jgi:hypothetical protein
MRACGANSAVAPRAEVVFGFSTNRGHRFANSTARYLVSNTAKTIPPLPPVVTNSTSEAIAHFALNGRRLRCVAFKYLHNHTYASFTQAAEVLGVTQAAISQQIGELEDSFEIAIF